MKRFLILLVLLLVGSVVSAKQFAVQFEPEHLSYYTWGDRADELINAYLDMHRLPKNLHLIFSAWKGLEMNNQHNLPEAHVFYKDGTTTARDGAKYCSGNCVECAVKEKNCWTIKKGEQILFKEH